MVWIDKESRGELEDICPGQGCGKGRARAKGKLDPGGQDYHRAFRLGPVWPLCAAQRPAP
jgi:hypothetical protein